jgi:acyl-CoA thioesterase
MERRTGVSDCVFCKLLGISLEEVEHGRVTMSLTTRPEFANPLEMLHGGVCATLLDSAMGGAVHSTLEAGERHATLELKINYVRAVALDGVKLTATARTVHLGRRTATAEGRVYDAQGRLMAHGTTTFIIHR